MARSIEEKRAYSREYARQKRKDPEWVKANYEKRRNNPKIKEQQRQYQETLRRTNGIETKDNIKEKQAHQFISRCQTTHNGKYDYSQVEYVNSHTPVIIICPSHGQFQQTPAAHSRGQNCPTCAMESRIVSNKRKATEAAEQFVAKANNIHVGLYDYSHSVYKSVHTKLEITCKEHGSFWQVPAAHLQGQGCPHCANDRRAAFAESKGEQSIARWLERHEISFEKQKMFEGCVDLLPLRFDFFLPRLNLIIEFDGRQHFEFVKKFHSNEEGFERCKRRDVIKNQYAKDHNIHMLRIKYSDEKHIEKILADRILDEIKMGELS